MTKASDSSRSVSIKEYHVRYVFTSYHMVGFKLRLKVQGNRQFYWTPADKKQQDVRSS